MRPRYVVMALLVGAFSAVGIVACGGDDDSPIVPVPTTTAPSDQAASQDEFIDEADAICEEANAAIANLAETTAGDTSSQISEEREIVEGMLDQIDSLGAPNQDEQTLDDFINALEELADNLDKQELAAERDDPAGLGELQTEETSIRTELATAADEYGFKECATEGGATPDAEVGGGGGAGVPGAAAPVAPAPAPEAPPPAPEAPAPAAPAPESGGTGGDTGGTSPGGGGGSGGVSP